MLEARRDLALPFICDADPKAAVALAELYEQTVGYELPGAGIMHDQLWGDDVISAHRRHSELLLEAAALCVPGINLPIQQTPGDIILNDPITLPHVDERSTHTEAFALLTLRLFTAGEQNGADVLLANARPGIFEVPGDSELYRYYPDEDAYGIPLPGALKRGYESKRFLNQSGMLDSIEWGSYDPIAVEPDIYYFHQLPLTSVFCRGLSLIGPSSVHGFISMDAASQRRVRYSDFHIRSQTL